MSDLSTTRRAELAELRLAVARLESAHDDWRRSFDVDPSASAPDSPGATAEREARRTLGRLLIAAAPWLLDAAERGLEGYPCELCSGTYCDAPGQLCPSCREVERDAP